MNDVIISPACFGDIPDLITIATTAYNQHYAYLWTDKGRQYVADHFNDRALRREMKDPDAAFFMIYFQSNLVGFLKLNKGTDPEGNKQPDCLEVERIYLLKEATGVGVGRQVMAFVLRLASKEKKQVVWLKAMESNAGAVSFYQKNGFKKCGTLIADKPLLKEDMRGMSVFLLELPVVAAPAAAPRFANQKTSKKELCLG